MWERTTEKMHQEQMRMCTEGRARGGNESISWNLLEYSEGIGRYYGELRMKIRTGREGRPVGRVRIYEYIDGTEKKGSKTCCRIYKT